MIVAYALALVVVAIIAAVALQEVVRLRGALAYRCRTNVALRNRLKESEGYARAWAENSQIWRTSCISMLRHRDPAAAAQLEQKLAELDAATYYRHATAQSGANAT